MSIRALVRDNIDGLVACFDDHEAGIDDEDTYICQCGWRGTAVDWYAHLADALGDVLTTRDVELPMAVA